MQTRTILNRIQKHKGFVYGRERFGPSESALSLLIPIRADKRCRPRCSGCDQPGPGYDRLPERRFEFIPMWGIAIFFLYALRRVDCKACGVRVEKVPWAQGKETLCTRYQWFLSQWAKKLSWKQVAEAFCTSWESVYKSVQMAVHWGLARRSLDGVEAIGVDEIAWHKNHKYLTLVYDIGVGSKRLLYIARDRTEDSLRGFFKMMGEEKSKKLVYVCSDMWAPYLNVIAERAAQAVNILDRFHIMKKFNEAIDQVRREEARRMKQEGCEPLLLHARWCLLKRVENLTERQASKLKELLRYNLRSVRAYLLREEFQRFWQYVRPSYAARLLDQWCKLPISHIFVESSAKL